MPIRRGLLSLLAREPMHGYQLRSEFDAATGATNDGIPPLRTRPSTSDACELRCATTLVPIAASARHSAWLPCVAPSPLEIDPAVHPRSPHRQPAVRSAGRRSIAHRDTPRSRWVQDPARGPGAPSERQPSVPGLPS